MAIPPGRSFDPQGGHADHLRLHFLFPPEELTAAIDALAQAWAAYDGARHPATRHTLIV
ncbi:hypothetical protein [Nonomuraea dietziae]|uniref:hypothetical protein n=1 Tax=Nonomuraea dietziae TaxID=65515 RepID=UPI0031DFDDEA